MELTEEIKNYLEQDRPAGVFMIDGEWGSGKTYYVENCLREEFKDSHLFIRISLFGLESVEEICDKVKAQWILANFKGYPDFDLKGNNRKTIKKILKENKSDIRKIIPERIGNITDTIFNIIPMNNIIDGKNVVLVFDDFERSDIPYKDLIGSINDYCENGHFFTIIIANEEEITKDSKNTDLTYEVLKEKLVQRRVRFEADYRTVIENIVNEITDDDYKEFLSENTDILNAILNGKTSEKEAEPSFNNKDNQIVNDIEQPNEELQRPLNIRSIKCAIQDFKRLYNKLKELNAGSIDKWLGSFACFVMAYRANHINENNYQENLFSSSILETLYPSIYHSSYRSINVFEWIMHGVWNDEAITADIKEVIERDRAVSSTDKVRTYRIMDLEDDDLNQGFTDVLEMAYNGSLTLDEYVNFIENSCWARIYGIDLKENINWEDIKKGIRLQLERILKSNQKVQNFTHIIADNQKQYFTTDEWSSYELIDDFRRKSVQIFSNNRNEYISLMKEDVHKAMLVSRSRRYDCFNEEMMEATFKAFEDADNPTKSEFPGWFNETWGNTSGVCYYDYISSLDIFRKLKDRLYGLQEDYINSGKQIAAFHTKEFAKTIESITDNSCKKK